MAEDPHARTALILYGSETGNSLDVAGELSRMAERLHFATRVSEMDAVDLNALLKYRVVIFAISTTGQGEFPKSARKFWKSLLRKRLPPGCLSPVRFTTFGLGDSSYPKFNWAARKLHKRLDQLGAHEIYPRGEADDQHEDGIDGTFLSWKADFQKHLLSLYPLQDGIEPIPADVLLPPKHVLQLVEVSLDNLGNGKVTTVKQDIDISIGQVDELVSSSISDYRSIHNGSLSDSATKPKELKLPEGSFPPYPGSFNAKLVGNKRITPDSHWQDVRELTLLMPKNVSYEPGDVITLYPKNFPEDVQTLIDLMDWNGVADVPITFVSGNSKHSLSEDLATIVPNLYPLPQTTLRDLLLHNLDITAIPKRYFFELLSHLTEDPMHKERLQEFSNPAFIDEFFDYATRPRRSILEVLQEFTTVRLPWQWATSIFPVIRGRQYSISSGGTLKNTPDSQATRAQLLVAIVKYRTVLKKVREGLCSRYIASVPEGSTIRISINEGSFNSIVQNYPHLPVLLVGPGTGLAPLRSLIWERAALREPGPQRPDVDVQKVGETVLFYGGRNQNADYLYRDEWKAMETTLGLKVFTAFSRDQREKIYVQDIIRKEKQAVWDVVARQAVIFVCGSSGSMPKAVREAVIDVMAELGPFQDREEAVEQLRVMERNGYYVQETW